MSDITIDAFDVNVPAGAVALDAKVTLPQDAQGIVVFFNAAGNGRFSAHNLYAAEALQSVGLATMLVDLLTYAEREQDAETHALRYDIKRLSERAVAVVDWMASIEQMAGLRVGLFGVSTGATAALITAAQRHKRIGAVVSRGGRPDLAMDHLTLVRSPTLLIVGGWDQPGTENNTRAASKLKCENHVEIVRGAGHRFEEPGKFEEVARLAGDWFVKYLRDDS